MKVAHRAGAVLMTAVGSSLSRRNMRLCGDAATSRQSELI
ncbi:hypothetical protein SBI_07719 [Streptomyces bingchenggensis BCW-1]|uniref:Uncharacterized protein n=1 Tax=Streptomyces bingchenggensis (strain BCW-1) TaxID=749414 RepID=D7CCZ2_STRBB|nr:hypothetical protein SBI_07719 [Streptomyces bingchenggensis BCW-1]